MNRIFLRLLALATLVTLGASAHAAERVKKVIIFGIDGCRTDAITPDIAPTLSELAAKGRFTTNGYTGGEIGTKSQQVTFSGPGWSTILTGVWTDKHGVKGNDFKGAALTADKHPHFFTLLKKENPKLKLASLVCWSAIDKFIVAPVRTDFAFTYDAGWGGMIHEEGDAKLNPQVDERLEKADDDLTFVHYGEVDGAGHRYGFSPKVFEYRTALMRVDAYIAKNLATLRARKTYANEDWLILVTTDHGGKGRSHGSQDEIVRRIFVIANGPGVAPEKIPSFVPQACIAPTVAEWMGVAPKPEWGWEAKSFLK